MRLRLELFVADLDVSVAFYERVLDLRLQRREEEYASLRAGDVVLGLGPISKLPERDPGSGFSQARLRDDRGGGVEIVLEVDDLGAALDRVRSAGHPFAEPLRDRPWGRRDFRIVDPDGYYWRHRLIARRERRRRRPGRWAPTATWSCSSATRHSCAAPSPGTLGPRSSASARHPGVRSGPLRGRPGRSIPTRQRRSALRSPNTADALGLRCA